MKLKKKTIINKKLKDKKSENLKFMPKDTLEKLHKELINISNTKNLTTKS